MIHVENLKLKISWHCPFKGTSPAILVWPVTVLMDRPGWGHSWLNVSKRLKFYPEFSIGVHSFILHTYFKKLLLCTKAYGYCIWDYNKSPLVCIPPLVCEPQTSEGSRCCLAWIMHRSTQFSLRRVAFIEYKLCKLFERQRTVLHARYRQLRKVIAVQAAGVVWREDAWAVRESLVRGVLRHLPQQEAVPRHEKQVSVKVCVHQGADIRMKLEYSLKDNR